MKTLLLFFFIAISSCSLIEEKNAPLKLFIDGDTQALAESASEVEEALTQYGTMGAGTYKAKVTVLTPVLIELKEKEKNLDEKALKKNIEEEKKKYSQNKTCFRIALRVINQAKYAYFDEWSGKILTEENPPQEFSLHWTKESLEKKPLAQNASAFHGKTEHYLNEGMACSLSPIPLSKGITLKLLPSYIQWPFDGSLDLSWDFIDPKAKPLKKIKEPYRGW